MWTCGVVGKAFCVLSSSILAYMPSAEAPSSEKM